MEFSKLEKELKTKLGTLNGHVGLFVKFLGDEKTIEHNSNEQLWAASVIKVLICATAYKLIDSEKITEKKYRVGPQNRVEGSGISKLFDEKTEFTLNDLVVMAIAISDNSATNQLIDILEREKIEEYIKKLGLQNTTFKHKMMIKEGLGPNLTTAADMAKLLEKLYKKEVPGSQDLLDIMAHSSPRNRIQKLLPNTVKVAHKHGSLPAAVHDIGIVYSKNPFVFCFLSDDQEDKEKTRKVLSECAKLCFDYSESA